MLRWARFNLYPALGELANQGRIVRLGVIGHERIAIAHAANGFALKHHLIDRAILDVGQEHGVGNGRGPLRGRPETLKDRQQDYRDHYPENDVLGEIVHVMSLKCLTLRQKRPEYIV